MHHSKCEEYCTLHTYVPQWLVGVDSLGLCSTIAPAYATLSQLAVAMAVVNGPQRLCSLRFEQHLA